MKLTESLLAAAVSGIVMGATAGCEKNTQQPANSATTPPGSAPGSNTPETKHSCKGQNACKGMGGCKVDGKNSCKGQNACKGQGGCHA